MESLVDLCWERSLFVEVWLVFSSVVWLAAVELFRLKNNCNEQFLRDILVEEFTALSSSGVKSRSICCLIGTIMMRKNGNAKEIIEDLTAQSIARAQT